MSNNGGVVNHDPQHETSKNNVKIRYIQHINIPWPSMIPSRSIQQLLVAQSLHLWNLINLINGICTFYQFLQAENADTPGFMPGTIASHPLICCFHHGSLRLAAWPMDLHALKKSYRRPVRKNIFQSQHLNPLIKNSPPSFMFALASPYGNSSSHFPRDFPTSSVPSVRGHGTIHRSSTPLPRPRRWSITLQLSRWWHVAPGATMLTCLWRGLGLKPLGKNVVNLPQEWGWFDPISVPNK